MELATPAEITQPTVQQMFATLLGEIVTLRGQIDDQQRQLEHIQLLDQDNSSLQSSRKLQFRHLPLEIREMIWDLATPRRLLGPEGGRSEACIPSALPVPAVAQVCRESRRVAMPKAQTDIPWGDPTTLWRLKADREVARWTWFTPHKDALLLDFDIRRQLDFRSGHATYRDNYALPRLAEHIIINSESSPRSVWAQFYDWGSESGRIPHDLSVEDDWKPTMDKLVSWVPGPLADCDPSADPQAACNLRTVDFALGPVTRIDRNYPPDLIRRLFAGDDVRVVDLRDEKAALGVRRMIQDELARVMDPSVWAHYPDDFGISLEIYRAVSEKYFPPLVSRLLSKVARSYHAADRRRRRDRLPPPFSKGELDMGVTWVKELCQRIDVRPVHVFVRAEGVSKVDW